MKRLSVLPELVVFLLLAVPVWAQSDRATFTGTVRDSSGGVVPGVSVTATNVDTGVGTPGTTNDVGIFSILNLPIGHYSLSFKKRGFQSVERTGLTLSIGQVAEINVTMSVGQVTQTIEVTAAAPILQSETTETGGSMSNMAYEALPLNINGGRDMQQFAIATIPSVEGDTWEAYVGGEQAFTTEILIDGTLAHEMETGDLTESNPPMEAVQEFKVDTGGMGGQAGMYTGGGTFEFTLKSGTNRLHGSAVGFLQNEVFDANSWTNNLGGVKRPRNRRDDVAFSAGGPVIIPKIYNGRNKTFVYAAWERYKQVDDSPSGLSLTVPTPDMLNGNFSALLGAPILDNNGNPISVQDTNGNTVPLVNGMIFDPASPGQVFPGNIIPTTRLSKASQQLVGLYQKYYQPLSSSLYNNYVTTQNVPYFEQKNLSVKVDENLSATDRMAGSIIHVRRPRHHVPGSGGLFSTEDPSGWGGPLGDYSLQLVSTDAFRLSESHNFSPNILNVAALTYQRFGQFPEAGASGEERLYPSGLWPSSAQPGITIGFGPSVNGVGETVIGDDGTTGFGLSESYVVDDTLTWLKGRHTLTFGGEWRSFQMNSGGATGFMSYNFSNDQTGAPTQLYHPYVGFGFASFLLGDVQSASEAIGAPLYGRRKSSSLYATDSFKLNSRLTLNYGLAWNYTFPLHEKYGRWANFDTSYRDPVTGVPGRVDYLSPSPQDLTGGSKTFETKEYWWDFAPHLGIAYKVTKHVVARAAYAMFDIPYGTDFWEGVPYGFAPGYFPTNQVLKTADFTPAFNWDNGYPGQNVYGTLDPNYMTWGMISMSPHALLPAINNQVNAGVEIELAKDTRLSLNYLTTRGIHLRDGSLRENQGQNSAYSTLLTSGNEWNTVSDPASAAASGVPYPYQGFSGPAWAALAPFPQIAADYNTVMYVTEPLGWSRYNAFQAEVTNRTSHGLTMDMSYTLARYLSTFPYDYRFGGAMGSNFVETWENYTWFQNLYDLSATGNFVNPFNQSIVKGYVLYSLPFGHGRKFLPNRGRWVNGGAGWLDAGHST